MQQHSSRSVAIVWWGFFTIIGIWAQRFVPGVDFLAPGLIVCLREQPPHRTLALAFIWMLLLEGMGNLPFGYGLAWYGMLVVFYIVGRWLFEARSLLFMCLLGVGMGGLHPLLTYGLAQLANLTIPMEVLIMEGVVQAVTFPVIWLVVDYFYPRKLRQDVRPL